MDEKEATRLRLVELQNETLTRENEMLTRETNRLTHENERLTGENAELRNMYNELKESLDEAVRTSRQQTAEHVLEPANSETSGDNAARTQGQFL